MALPEGSRHYLLAPVVRGRKGEYRKELAEWQKAGFTRVRIDGAVLRDRGSARARQEVQARHRGRGRPHRRPRRHRGAPRRQLRDRAEARRRARLPRPGRSSARKRARGPHQRPRHGEASSMSSTARPAASSSPRNSPARSPASPSPRSSRGCSASTRRRAPARPATASARSWCSTRTSSSPTTTCRSPRARSCPGPSPTRPAPITCRCCASLARAYDFDLDTPWTDLPEEAQRVILHGTGGNPVTLRFIDGQRSYEVKKPFEGVIGNLNRRMLQTEIRVDARGAQSATSRRSRAKSATAPASSPRRWR